jgi:hypothetical protein
VAAAAGEYCSASPSTALNPVGIDLEWRSAEQARRVWGVRRALGFLVAVSLGCALAATAAAGGRGTLQHVTIFGDSAAATLDYVPAARRVLARGNRLTLDVDECRRLAARGCFSPPPPSVLDDVRRLGRKLGSTVIVFVGYNDDPHMYAARINTVLRAMHRRGVKRVLWLTLRAVSGQYVATNQVIVGASRRFPWMTVLNWNGYSRGRTSWFASDGIHFTAAGAVQLATYLHRALKRRHLTGPARNTSLQSQSP